MSEGHADIANASETVTRRADRMLEALERHPVLRRLPDEAQTFILETGAWRELAAGKETTAGGGVGFLVVGAVTIFDRRALAGVVLQVPGSMFGFEATLATPPPVCLLSLLDSAWIEVSAAGLVERMGKAWTEHVFARHALDQLARLQAQAACNAVHDIPHRAANLVQRLSTATGPEVRTTQAILARAMGVQRTSMNAAMKSLEREGAICVRRGRMTVVDPARLRRFSCSC